jgi:hypothetical protein
MDDCGSECWPVVDPREHNSDWCKRGFRKERGTVSWSSDCHSEEVLILGINRLHRRLRSKLF